MCYTPYTKGVFMKYIIFLLFIVSCGSNDNTAPYLFKSDRLESVWVSGDKSIEIQANTITFFNIQKGLFTSDCSFEYETSDYNDFYKTLTLSNPVGDTFTCSDIPSSIGIEILYNSKENKDILKILGDTYYIQ